MSFMAITDNTITVAKGDVIDHYDYTNHMIIKVPTTCKPERDTVSDIVISKNGEYLALITSASKQLIVYNLPLIDKCKNIILHRTASKLRFTANGEQILVADKSGDAYLYTLKNEQVGNKLLGHLSLLLDILQTNDENYIITCDRDEKIKISCYPNTYNIHSYCLGHKEFVNHIELLSHDMKYLTSTSGDGHVKCWEYENGSLLHSIDTYLDVDDPKLKDNFIKYMESEGVNVTTLPIVHFTVTKVGDNSTLLAVAVHTFHKLLIYNLQSVNSKFSHKLIEKLNVDRVPAAIKFNKLSLYVYDEVESCVKVFKVIDHGDNFTVKPEEQIKMFDNVILTNDSECCHDSIKALYKRKFDNVQEYQDRKRRRLEKS